MTALPSAMARHCFPPLPGPPTRFCHGRFGAVPTDAVTGFCAITAIFSLICHLALEQTVWPQGTGQWLAGLGLLPVGAAFYAWDFGVKRGDIRVLGTASYAAPLLSTLILIASGVGRARLAHRSCLRPDHRGRRAGRKGSVVCASAPGRTGREMMRIFECGLNSPQPAVLSRRGVYLSFHGGETALGAAALMMLILISVFKLSIFRFG